MNPILQGKRALVTGGGRGIGAAIVRRLADTICKFEHFAQDAGQKLYIYRRGVYKRDGEETVRRSVKSLTQEWKRDEEWSGFSGLRLARLCICGRRV